MALLKGRESILTYGVAFSELFFFGDALEADIFPVWGLNSYITPYIPNLGTGKLNTNFEAVKRVLTLLLAFKKKSISLAPQPQRIIS